MYQCSKWRGESKTPGAREYSVTIQRQSFLVRSMAHEKEEEMRKSLGSQNLFQSTSCQREGMRNGCSGKSDWSHLIDTEFGNSSTAQTQADFLFKQKQVWQRQYCFHTDIPHCGFVEFIVLSIEFCICYQWFTCGFFLQLDKTISNSNPVLQCLHICYSLVSSVDLIGLLSVLSSNIVMKILNHIKLKTGS